MELSRAQHATDPWGSLIRLMIGILIKLLSATAVPAAHKVLLKASATHKTIVLHIPDIFLAASQVRYTHYEK